MADISGLDAALQIYQARQTPIVLLSGYCDPKTVRNAEENHILLYLVKPISKTHLAAALTRCLDELPVARHNDAGHGEVQLQTPAAPATDSRYGMGTRRTQLGR
jgi:YesN/AraC family two-component response regulator